MDYGTDFLLKDDDLVFTAEGDAEIVSGPAMVAQDIDQTLKTAPGSLYWDKELGSTMPFFLNDSGADAASVIAELERVAIDDRRVDPDSVKAVQRGAHTFRLELTPMGAVSPSVLDYDLNKNKESA